MSYEQIYATNNQTPLYLTGQDAALVRNILNDPTGFLDEYTDHVKMSIKNPKQSLRFAMIQPATMDQAGAWGTLNRDWVDRFQDYAAANARGDREAAFAAISAEIKSANGTGNVAAVPLHLSANDIGALAVGVANTRTKAYKEAAIAAGVPTTVKDAIGNELPREDREIAHDFRIRVGAPVPYIKAISAGVGAPIEFRPHCETCTPAHIANATSITGVSIAATEQMPAHTEFHVPVAAAMKLIGQSILHKEREIALYHQPIEAPITSVSSTAVKAMENHLAEVSKSGSITAMDVSKIGEHMCNDSTKCVGEARFDNQFIGLKYEGSSNEMKVGTSLNDVISAVQNIFPVGSESPFTDKSEAKLREAIGASQGAVITAKNAPKSTNPSVSYDLFVGSNFLPAVGYHMENPTKAVKKTGVFSHEGEHFTEFNAPHAVISAKMQDGTCIETLLLPVSGGVKIIGDHVRDSNGKHKKHRGHTVVKDKAMGMFYN